ncbi:MAG: hypothetical protein PWR20_1219 [Bacteroidales bacterium]|nr:hypothetical protein [Bacteroidales bacterium]MDN5329381.1 hypothetical protein [Bacteroidales bacterium]
MKVSKNFVIQEFVGPAIINARGEKAIQLLDYRIILIAQFIRDYFGRPMTINNWHIGGHFTERGFREPQTHTGAPFSQHKFGRAIDFTLDGLSPEEIRTEILKNQQLFLEKGLTCIEAKTPTWVHIDCRYTGLDKILIVYP